jgi:hypothetical protein
LVFENLWAVFPTFPESFCSENFGLIGFSCSFFLLACPNTFERGLAPDLTQSALRDFAAAVSLAQNFGAP